MFEPHRIFVHLPYTLLQKYRPLLAKMGLAIEFLIEAEHLGVAKLESLAEEIRQVKEISGRVAIHAPYEELDPGHPEEAEREETLRLLTLTCGLAQAIGASYVVVHAGYEPTRAGDDPAGWLQRSLATWKELLEQPASLGVILALEHTFEPDPSILRTLMENLPGDRVGVCLDTGHLNCFAKAPPSEWWLTLGARIAVIHLHDNGGAEDDHLGIGQGTFDFESLFRWLKRSNVRPFGSIEGRDPKAVAESLAALGYPVDEALLDG